MAYDITLPSLSAGMEDATIAQWLVATGDKVTKGQVLAEVETDKATMELEAEADGIIGALHIAAGKRADVGQKILTLLAEGENLDKSLPEQSAAVAPAPAKIVPPQSLIVDRKHSASPLARRLAREAGLDLQGIQGSGAHGRIVRLDIERALQAPEPRIDAPEVLQSIFPAPNSAPVGIGPYDAVPVSNMRRVIARRLVEAKTTVPHFYLSSDCNIDALLALRAQINEGRDKAERISVNDMVIKAAARALRLVPKANVIWHGDEILELADVDISVAVATDSGLITPIIRGADRLSLGSLAREMRDLASRARDGKLRPEDYQGGGFSISNLGMYGVKSFAAIINPPQSCILAVGAAEERPIGRQGEIVLAQMMSVTLSVDHRSVDGALGAALLAAFKATIERPFDLLL